MTKRYPLATLLRLREHRTETARLYVLECQRVVAACREACAVIEGEIRNLQATRNDQRRRLLDPPPPGVAWPIALEQREAHIELLANHIVLAQQRLAQAQQKLREAEQVLADARTAFFRAKARQEALEKRRDTWRGEQRALEARVEEAVTEDLLASARHLQLSEGGDHR